jgi:hypothetical protein
MEDAVGLHCATVHGHPRTDVILADLEEFDAEMLAHRVVLELADLFERELAEPDTHGWLTSFRLV